MIQTREATPAEVAALQRQAASRRAGSPIVPESSPRIVSIHFRGETIHRQDIAASPIHASQAHLQKMLASPNEHVEATFENGDRAVILAAAAWSLLLESAWSSP